MIVYVVLIEDRHCDVEVLVFDSVDKALDYAKLTAITMAARYDREPREVQIADWLYYASVSKGSDSVRMEKKFLL